MSIMLITGLLTLAAHALPARNIDLEKSSPYECGFDPLNSARIPFSFRFFLVAILFLLFDLEIALLFPLPPSLLIINPNIPLFLTSLFLIILTVGLIFEWLQGGLDWAE
uniref:NADH-ubiquinone oxidoreductase chain 3 n=1 Tax=Linckia laevigata TaxID=109185 RepID=A0A679EAZ5_LINLA|nr:NADH dehydrogenase subunit 3 [Linckia laevigata]